MQAQPGYMKTCLWLLAFLLFGYAIRNVLMAVILRTLYDIEGDKKAQMYKELEQMRAQRHAENEAITREAASEAAQ